jgi:hypothetical protein
VKDPDSEQAGIAPSITPSFSTTWLMSAASAEVFVYQVELDSRYRFWPVQMQVQVRLEVTRTSALDA